jgi:hypothetical protein
MEVEKADFEMASVEMVNVELIASHIFLVNAGI